MELRALEDNELLALLSNDNADALKVIYLRYWRPLYTSAFNILKNSHACEDIIQEIFVKIWNRRKEMVVTISLKAYLFACVRHEVFRQIKKGAVHECIFEHLEIRLKDHSQLNALEYKELLNRINDVVDALPDKCKEVYKLSREEDLSHRQIAEKLNISTKTVENHITKALKVLRGSLGDALILSILIGIHK